MQNAAMWTLAALALFLNASDFEAAAQNMQRGQSRSGRQRWRDDGRGRRRAAERCSSVDGGINMCGYQSHSGLINRESSYDASNHYPLCQTLSSVANCDRI